MSSHAASFMIPTSGKGTYEGSDDMPSHLRMVLTRTSEVIPIVNGTMTLGTWQGIFLFEYRDHPRLTVMVQGELMRVAFS